MQKVPHAMKSSEQFPMEGNVHVDEFVIAKKEEGKPGRSSETEKKKVVCAIEMSEQSKIKRFYATPIENYSSDELSVLFNRHISVNAQITTDQWTGYNRATAFKD